MASQVKVVTSDITAKKSKNLLVNIVKHAVSSLLGDSCYKYAEMIKTKNQDLV
jgi:hypothetical protein